MDHTGPEDRSSLPSHQSAKNHYQESPESLLSLLIGMVLLIRGISQRSVIGLIAGTMGIILIRKGTALSRMRLQDLGGDIDQKNRETMNLPETGSGRFMEIVTIRCPKEEVYNFLLDFQKSLKIVRNLDFVAINRSGNIQGVLVVSPEQTLRWEVQLVDERSQELIIWETVGNSNIQSQGYIRLKADVKNRNTELRLHLTYRAPLGNVKIHHPLRKSLLHLKQLLEGEKLAAKRD